MATDGIRGFGCKKDDHDPRDRPLTALEEPKGQIILPTSVVPIYDQGAVGSCTANAFCRILRFLDFLADGKLDLDYARLALYYWTRSMEGTPPAGDWGAQIRNTFKAALKYGVPEERLHPYNGYDSSFSKEPSETARVNALIHQALFYYRCSNLATVKSSLWQGFPVEIGFQVFQSSMAAAADGEMKLPDLDEKSESGHAVSIEGADDNKRIGGENGALWIANSWGKDFGIQGFFWMPYSYFIKYAWDCWTLRAAEVV